MVIHELTRGECLEFLLRTTIGRLACARDDQPYVVPISFYCDATDQSLYGFSTVGQKIHWMRANPRVCVEVDEISDRFHWTTVVVTGVYEEIQDAALADAKQARAIELFQQRSQWWLPAAGKVASGQERDMPVVYRIRINKVSGRRAARPE